MFGGGGMQGAKGSASAGGLLTRMQVATAIKTRAESEFGNGGD